VKAGGKQSLWPPVFTLVSGLGYSSTPKIEATFFSETSVDFSTDYSAFYPKR
jgi:hypothetical protein